MARFPNNFTEMFLICLFTNIARMVPLCWTKWLPELKIDKFCKVFFLCYCFTESSFPAGTSQISYFKVLPWQTSKMVTFNWHLSSLETSTSTSYLELRWAIQGHMVLLSFAFSGGYYFFMATAISKWPWLKLDFQIYRSGTRSEHLLSQTSSFVNS